MAVITEPTDKVEFDRITQGLQEDQSSQEPKKAAKKAAKYQDKAKRLKKKAKKAKAKAKRIKKGFLAALKRRWAWVKRQAKRAWNKAKSMARKAAKWLKKAAAATARGGAKVLQVIGETITVAAEWVINGVSVAIGLVVLGALLGVQFVLAVIYKTIQGIGLVLRTPYDRIRGKKASRERWGSYWDAWRLRNLLLPISLQDVAIREAVHEQHMLERKEAKAKAKADKAAAKAESTQTSESVHPAQQPKNHPTPKQVKRRRTRRHHGPRTHGHIQPVT